MTEIKQCKNCKKQFTITDQDLAFYDKISPIFAGKKYQIPTPTHCPACRQQRRLVFRNERHLYRRKCDFSGKNIISDYRQDTPFPVYEAKIWHSDAWDAKQYGQDYDFNKTFFQQFQELQNKVPKLSLIYDNNENCDYTHLVGDSKNCYLVFGSAGCENCMYGTPYFSTNCFDSLVIQNCENCFECIDSENLYQCFYSQNCRDSRNLIYCFGVEGSQNCFGCVGLINQQNCIFNQQYTKEEYDKKIAQIDIRDENIIFEIEKKLEYLRQHLPQRNIFVSQTENVLGDYLFNAKNCQYTFSGKDIENMRYCSQVTDAHDCMDIDYGEHSEGGLYEYIGFWKSFKCIFSDRIRKGSNNLIYCSHCLNNVQNCFGCIGLRQNNQYCILNRQYTKEEYEQLVPKIIEHMQHTGERGEFFPIQLSEFCYNETVAQDYYPLTQKEAKEKGYPWLDKDYPINISEGMKIIDGKDIKLYDDNQILCIAIRCIESGRIFRIVKQELEFYRKYNLPLPSYHPEIRHQHRLVKKNPRKLFQRTCSKCSKDISSTYTQSKQELVYCEKCYNQEVYG